MDSLLTPNDQRPPSYPYVRPKSPPSSYAIAAVLEGERGAWWRVARATGTRALLLIPGLWVGGVRGTALFTGALAGSAGLTVALYRYYWRKRRRGLL